MEKKIMAKFGQPPGARIGGFGTLSTSAPLLPFTDITRPLPPEKLEVFNTFGEKEVDRWEFEQNIVVPFYTTKIVKTVNKQNPVAIVVTFDYASWYKTSITKGMGMNPTYKIGRLRPPDCAPTNPPFARGIHAMDGAPFEGMLDSDSPTLGLGTKGSLTMCTPYRFQLPLNEAVQYFGKCAPNVVYKSYSDQLVIHNATITIDHHWLADVRKSAYFFINKLDAQKALQDPNLAAAVFLQMVADSACDLLAFMNPILPPCMLWNLNPFIVKRSLYQGKPDLRHIRHPMNKSGTLMSPTSNVCRLPIVDWGCYSRDLLPGWRGSSNRTQPLELMKLYKKGSCPSGPVKI